MNREHNDPEDERAMLQAEWYKFVRNFLIPLLGFFIFAVALLAMLYMIVWVAHHL